ncbi:MAG: DUF5666 domain-containing protein [Chloroflexota bacterium]
MKGALKAVLALIIIIGGAGIGFLLANTNLGKASTATPVVVSTAVANAAAATTVPTFTPNALVSAAGSPRANTTAGVGGQRSRPTGAGANTTAGAGETAQPNTTPSGLQGSTAPDTSTTPSASITDSTTPSASTAAGTGGQNTQQGQQRATQLVGIIASFDATAKRLVVTIQDGSSRNVSVANATLSKADKISLDDISKTTGATLMVQGDKADDGSYTARSVMLIDSTAAQGAGRSGIPGGGGQSGLVILTGATVNGNTLSGKSFQGDEVKVNVSENTTLTKQTAATPEELTEGKKVTVSGQPGSNDEIEARSVSLT